MKVLQRIAYLIIIACLGASFSTKATESNEPKSARQNFARVLGLVKPNTLEQPAPVLPKTVPVTFYDSEHKDLTLLRTQEDNKPLDPFFYPKDLKKIFHDVNSYHLSPKKQYLVIQEKSIKETFLFRMIGKVIDWKSNLGEWLALQLRASDRTRLVNAHSFEEITTFDSKIITNEFNDDETVLLIAKIQGGMLKHELFDIPTQTIIHTFDNVETIVYIDTNTLFVKYRNGSMEQATIQRIYPSALNRFISMLEKQPLIKIKKEPIDQRIFPSKIYYSNGWLILKTPNKPEQKFSDILSYNLSPQQTHLLIRQPSKTQLTGVEKTINLTLTRLHIPRTITTLIDLKNGNIVDTFENLITYEFIPDDTETKLLILSTQQKNIPLVGIQYGSSDYHYRLYDTTKKSVELIRFDQNIASAYFKSPTELVAVNNNGELTIYDPITTTSFAEMEAKEKVEQAKEKVEQAKTKAKAETKQQEQEKKVQAIREKDKNLLKQMSESGLYDDSYIKFIEKNLHHLRQSPANVETAEDFFQRTKATFERKKSDQNLIRQIEASGLYDDSYIEITKERLETLRETSSENAELYFQKIKTNLEKKKKQQYPIEKTTRQITYEENPELWESLPEELKKAFPIQEKQQLKPLVKIEEQKKPTTAKIPKGKQERKESETQPLEIKKTKRPIKFGKPKEEQSQFEPYTGSETTEIPVAGPWNETEKEEQWFEPDYRNPDKPKAEFPPSIKQLRGESINE